MRVEWVARAAQRVTGIRSAHFTWVVTLSRLRKAAIVRDGETRRCRLCKDSWWYRDPEHHSFVDGQPCILRQRPVRSL